MVFAHDTELALQSAAALVNSAEDPDTLTTVEELAELLERFEYSGRHDGTESELAEVQALRPTLRSLLTAERDQAVLRVNELLREHEALPQLVRHDGWDWHLHAIDSDAPLAARMAVETAMAMVDVLRADELSRLSVCEDDGCAGVVVDLTRNRSRRYCSTTCSNRNAVAAYRARQAEEGSAG